MNVRAAVLLLACCLALPARAGIYEDLLNALERGDNPAAIALLDRGLDPNSPDQDGTTLLMLAARSGNQDMLEALLKRRAKPNLQNRHGDTALRLAAFKGSLPAVRALVEAGAAVDMPGWTPLIYAAFGGHTEVVAYLAEMGARIDARSDNGSTALMMAARNGHLETVRRLLAYRADPNQASDLGERPLDYALRNGNTLIADVLRDAGAVSGRVEAGGSQPVVTIRIGDDDDEGEAAPVEESTRGLSVDPAPAGRR